MTLVAFGVSHADVLKQHTGVGMRRQAVSCKGRAQAILSIGTEAEERSWGQKCLMTSVRPLTKRAAGLAVGAALSRHRGQQVQEFEGNHPVATSMVSIRIIVTALVQVALPHPPGGAGDRSHLPSQ
jgi:hypothetical protein